ncbi:MAG: HAMP domain-containing protein [Gammaproteobacteria bacterium]|nr:MAG: HAMP domain-containing protein [Gammaproteobacteria bacterium]
MALATLKHPRFGLALMMALLALLLGSLHLMSNVTQSSEQFSRLYLPLLALNGVALVALSALIVTNLARLLRQFRQGVAGSRLTLRMMLLFVTLAVAPVSVVFYFSLGFLHRSIDSWFDVRIERALDDALELSRVSLDARLSELLNQTARLVLELEGAPDGAALSVLNELRARSSAGELTLFTQKGRVIASSGGEFSSIVPDTPGEAILLQLGKGQNYVGLDPIRDTGLHVRVVVSAPPGGAGEERRVLQALFPVAARQSELAAGVQAQVTQYKRLAYLRQPLKYTFTVTLSLVLALSLLSAVWAAFFSTRRLVAPIRDLAEGTRAVAAGDYTLRLPLQSRDELGFLVMSFNDMTQKIARARDALNQSQQRAEGQRAYLQALLQHLSSGVLTLDHQQRLRTANAAASELLGIALDDHAGTPLDTIAERHPRLAAFIATLRHHLAAPAGEWREEVILEGAGTRKILLCRGTALPATESGGDYLIVFDDITALIQAQRDAAWGEVARRLAHEFKNPLTPIQLSAERLRHKYLKTLDAGEGELLDRLTHTIVQQVEVMKDMVNAFADYARNPPLQTRPLDLNRLINEVLDLYRGQRAQFQTRLEAGLPPVEADAGRLRQLLHNLIKNALEAAPDSRAHITLETHSLPGFVELSVRDHGPGIPKEIMAQLFEPYVTTKPRGTGLGLAIVKKIAEEHGGSLSAENPQDGGARLVLRLPVSAAAPDMQPLPHEARTL